MATAARYILERENIWPMMPAVGFQVAESRRGNRGAKMTGRIIKIALVVVVLAAFMAARGVVRGRAPPQSSRSML